jgi:hypothetical protein
MEGDDLLRNFYQAINVTMRPNKRKKVIANVFNRKIKTGGLYVCENTHRK